jgi:hypothetical protein
MIKTSSNTECICPYCKYSWQPEPCDFHDDMQVEKCAQCGMRFHSYDEVEITHYAMRDCEINNEQHEADPGKVLCSKCGKFMKANK